MSPRLPWLVPLTVLALGAMAVMASTVGAMPIAPSAVWHALWEPLTPSSTESTVLWAIRFPRVGLAMVVGTALACSGAVLQALFRNPLADPGLLGLSSGASVAVAGALLFVDQPGPWSLPLAAFAGAGLAAAVVLTLGRRHGAVDVSSMLLAGIALNAIGFSGVGLMMYLADEATLRSLTFWTLGSLAGASWSMVGVMLVLCLPALVWALWAAASLNAMLLGEPVAAHLGVSVSRLKLGAVLATAVLVGAAVAASGMIGFIGLVVPHLVRLVVGPDLRRVLPLSAVVGPLLLLTADTLSRTLAAPGEVPVGVFTTLIGGPLFLWLLRRRPA